MALYTELPVYRDTYQLTLKVFEYTREFARDYKFTLGNVCLIGKLAIEIA